MSSKVEGDQPTFLREARLHHLGIAVRSISEIAEGFHRSMFLQWDRRVIHDPIQQVNVSFFVPVDSSAPQFELVEAAGKASPVSAFLDKGGGLHHLCYEIQGLDRALGEAREAGFVVLRHPAPAVAFEGRRIAWLGSRWRLTIELLERCGAERTSSKDNVESA